METELNFIDIVREAGSKKLLFLPHAMSQMNRPERMINTAEVQAVIGTGIIIEDYPEDSRGHSCLISGFGETGRPVHVVCTPKDEYLAVITAYIPNKEQWHSDWQTRKKK